MRPSHRQIVLAAGLLATALMGGGTHAWAGYISVAGLNADEGINGLSPFVASLLTERESSGGAVSFQLTDASEVPSPTAPAFPFVKLPQAAHAFGPTGSTGSQSNSGNGNGPSNLPIGVILRPQVPPAENTSLLSPEKSESHPHFVASYLFRPPRQGHAPTNAYL